MTETDIDYGVRVGRELKAASSLFSPPPRLSSRVAELERRHRRHRAGMRVGAIGVAAAATVGVLARARQIQPSDGRASAQPSTSTLGPSATFERIDAYPMINWPGDPIPGVGASYGWHDDDQGWGGTIGVVHPAGAPTAIVAIHAFPVGWGSPLPATEPGRISGVREATTPNGNTILSWYVGRTPLVVTGDDVDLLYQLVDVIQPMAATPRRGGYQFSGPLPGGLTELEAPQHRIPMRTPSVSTNDGTFGVSVDQGPLLETLAGGGFTRLEPISINGLNGYRSTTGAPTIGLAVSTDETLFIYAQNMTIDELTEIAKHVTITDETNWRSHYQVTD